MKKSSSNLIFTVVTILNIALYLLITFRYSFIFLVSGIALIIISIYTNIKLPIDENSFNEKIYKKWNIKIYGLNNLFFGILGILSMFELSKFLDLNWFYYLLVNIYILSSMRIKFQKKADSQSL